MSSERWWDTNYTYKNRLYFYIIEINLWTKYLNYNIIYNNSKMWTLWCKSSKACFVELFLQSYGLYSLQDSSVHVIILVRILEWVAVSLSRGHSWCRDWTHIYCISNQILYYRATREAHIHNFCAEKYKIQMKIINELDWYINGKIYYPNWYTGLI